MRFAHRAAVGVSASGDDPSRKIQGQASPDFHWFCSGACGPPAVKAKASGKRGPGCRFAAARTTPRFPALTATPRSLPRG
jgi:hypothetical protein